MKDNNAALIGLLGDKIIIIFEGTFQLCKMKQKVVKYNYSKTKVIYKQNILKYQQNISLINS